MKKLFALIMTAVLMLSIATPAFAAGGFDEFGYNDTARIFNGTGESWCVAGGQTLAWCDAYLGSSANDKIIMKWNAAWDACVQGNEPECAGAWTSNEWNGMVPGGSGAVWHYKIVWVGPCGADGTLLSDGGYCLWGSYEVVMDQGVDSSYGPEHLWFAHANPTGYGNH